MDQFQLDPNQLPPSPSKPSGEMTLQFNVDDLKLPLQDISLNTQDKGNNWTSAKTVNDPTSTNYTVQIANPKNNLQAIGINYNGKNGACIIRPANLICTNNNCDKLYPVAAKWSPNGQGPCTIIKN
ncbi:hypothetical protein DGG96_11645 [Legionella qingyii]|uniref:Uncharacterized protein n=1 Tax=Legionella qingyii TaxID=2184757 RepID=A0A317U3K8_9GAMM|nr:hypothetical protein [Legionella qingyii]PWY55427.1 hypothetical protein DGG96_11645 [Legionella qingyii]RUR21369.1 hypothetical protein ELY20_12790 [Legionella qingyii]RUR24593.1 hypothetical protein ELY16_11625 [Legionella qingyii]